MKNKYGSFIQQLRLHKKLSQEDVARKLDISRPSYIAIEKGTKHLTFEEAKAITKLFDITLEELLRGESLSEQKFEEMIFSFLRRARETGKELKKTKLAKLLYFADFGKYYLKGESISNLAYRKIEFGPVPDEYFRILQELEDESLIEVKPIPHEDGGYMYEISDTAISAKRQLNLLDKQDNKLIDEIWEKWQDANTNDIVKYTHHQSPYMETEFNHIIPYELIKNEAKETVF